ncbi:hypothetical protein PAPHI01_2549 [Pancytospora philotis]|nr:hypothetical protein PAPHI01_2549 [Pancytospora philotis]
MHFGANLARPVVRRSFAALMAFVIVMRLKKNCRKPAVMFNVYALANFAGKIGIYSINTLVDEGLNALAHHQDSTMRFRMITIDLLPRDTNLRSAGFVESTVEVPDSYKKLISIDIQHSVIMALGYVHHWMDGKALGGVRHLNNESKLFQVAGPGRTYTESFEAGLHRLYQARRCAAASFDPGVHPGDLRFIDLAAELGRESTGAFAFIATSRLYPAQMVGYTSHMPLYVGLPDADCEQTVEKRAGNDDQAEDGPSVYVYRIATKEKHFELSSDFISFGKRIMKLITLSPGDTVHVSAAGLEVISRNGQGLAIEDFAQKSDSPTSKSSH